MASGVTVTLDDRPIARLIKEFPDRAAAFVKALAFKVESLAKRKAPVDTGALRNSIRAFVWGEGSAGNREASPKNRFEAVIAVLVWYGLYVEMGTRFTKARPFLFPSVYEVVKEGRRAAEKLFEVGEA